ncbi:MAG: lysylphosphatidylglycerol synthase transmembrane domain-containing protein [Candidatus Nitrosocaldaceae archaeon]
MLWRIIAIISSIIPIIIISFLLDVSISDIFEVGLFQFIIASILTLSKIFIQGFRFNYYIKNFVGDVISLKTAIIVRLASEFVALTTPSYTGGEIVRLTFLYKRRVNPGISIWIVTIEVISDVIIGCILSYISAFYAFIVQNYLISLIIILITTPLITFYILLLFLLSKRIIQIPKFVQLILSKLIGKRSNKLIDDTNKALLSLYETSDIIFNMTSLKTLIIGFILTLICYILFALSFTVLSNITFFESILLIGNVLAMSAIPISPGGSGLTELGAGYYLTVFDLDPTTFASTIIVWRIATYYLSLFMSWIALTYLIKSL